MTIEVNSNFPVQTLRLVVAGELQEVDSSEYLADKKVMLVGVPGAFTPTCHVSHLPGYIEHLSSFEAKGYSVVFISVNDPFVMKAWSEASNARWHRHDCRWKWRVNRSTWIGDGCIWIWSWQDDA